MNAAATPMIDAAVKVALEDQRRAVRRAYQIKLAMRRKRITQAAAANELKISQSAVSRYISGKAKSARFDEWCQARLGLDLEEV